MHQEVLQVEDEKLEEEEEEEEVRHDSFWVYCVQSEVETSAVQFISLCYTHTHTHTHARMRARTHAHIHTHT